jgi:hypothetical protein
MSYNQRKTQVLSPREVNHDTVMRFSNPSGSGKATSDVTVTVDTRDRYNKSKPRLTFPSLKRYSEANGTVDAALLTDMPLKQT